MNDDRPNVVISIDELCVLFLAALDRGELERADELAGLVLARNDRPEGIHR